MGDSVPVRCPECLSTQAYAAPVFPCACGSPVAPPVVAGAVAEPITHRNWTDEWVTVRCGACGREDDWPHPELGCPCGAILRVPVRTADTARPTGGPADRPGGSTTGADRTPSDRTPSDRTHSARTHSSDTASGDTAFGDTTSGHTTSNGPAGAGRSALDRAAFRPVTIRTGRDAVAAAAGYLRWLGFREVVQPEERPASGVDLRAPGLVAQVDPSTRPTGLRAVECLWLNGLSASAASVFFSLAGYTPEARSRAAEVGLPLFVLDLTGTPQPVNRAADELAADGA
ncbi:hypothetical protein [Streptomyces sp. cmx-4-7]|uniref:hypothetical protein n=1 Tax=Streptomyces sp. cmx-4-7 TaxID=2790939 RepID=UPI00397FB38B